MQSSVLSTGGGKALINPADTLILLLDHQTGLFQTVKDIGVMELRANTIALAKLGALLKLPVITTSSVPDGPNGPPMPELKEAAPHAHYVPRHGKVYAVMDASGDPSEMVSRTTLARFVQGGVVPTTVNAVVSEIHRTWNRPEAAELAQLYTMYAPNYRAVMELSDGAASGEGTCTIGFCVAYPEITRPGRLEPFAFGGLGASYRPRSGWYGGF